MDALLGMLQLTPAKKKKRHRGFRQWHWEKEGQWKHYSSHWDKEDALENQPTKPGAYLLVRGSHGSFVIEREITVED